MSQYGGQQQQYGGQNAAQQDPSQSQGQQQYGGQDASQQDPSQSQYGGQPTQNGYGQQDPSQQDPSQQDPSQQDPSHQDPSQQDPSQSQYGGQQGQAGTDGQTDPSQQQAPSQYPKTQQGYNQPMKNPMKGQKGDTHHELQHSKGAQQGQHGPGRNYDANHHNAMYVEAQPQEFHDLEVQNEEELTSEKVPHVQSSLRWLHQRPHGILHPPRYLRSRCPLQPARSRSWRARRSSL